MEYSHLLLEKREGVLIIILNRPEVRNALSVDLLSELHRALVDAEADEGVDVVIITGAGKAFSSGIDASDFAFFTVMEGDTEYEKLQDAFGSITVLSDMTKPTIAAVNGAAVTGAFELVLRCDVVIASESARFADTHARVGIIPGGGMTQILPRLVGAARARDISFTGRFIGATEAYDMGLVSRVVPDDVLMDEALSAAAQMRLCPKDALREIKNLINRGLELPLGEGLLLEQDAFNRWRRSIDPARSAGALKTIARNKDNK
ncbi:MAG: enoyl-CoA hydratase [Deltaproteobacteria bacterium]|nr:enoyl-CoA hydratase [Candidatus Zymogenaceae bacterium]